MKIELVLKKDKEGAIYSFGFHLANGLVDGNGCSFSN